MFTDDGPSHRTVDHRVPRSRGGSNRIGNLVFACYACNQRKRDRGEQEFRASQWLVDRRRSIEAGRDLNGGTRGGATP